MCKNGKNELKQTLSKIFANIEEEVNIAFGDINLLPSKGFDLGNVDSIEFNYAML